MRLLKRSDVVAVSAAILIGAACGRDVNLDKVPVGTDVTVVRDDGGVVRGSLERVAPQAVVVRVGNRSRTVPRDAIADVTVTPEDGTPPPLPPAAKFRSVIVPAGTPLSVRVLTPLASDETQVEDRVSAELAEPVRLDGRAVLPAGAHLTGVVTAARPSAKVKGLAYLAFRFEVIRADDEQYPVAVAFGVTADATKASDAKKIGVPAAGGAILGGILGGKKGAVVGGVIGGGAGAAAVLTTPGKEVKVPSGTVLQLPLDRDLDVKVPIR